MNFSGECSVMKQITKTEEAITTCYERIKTLEDKIDSKHLPNGQKNAFRTELVEVKKLLATSKDQLSTLHQHNRKSFVFVAAIVFICFALYSIFVLVYGTD